MNKMRSNFEHEMLSPSEHLDDVTRIPAKGRTEKEIVAMTKEYLGCGEFDWTEGKQSGTVYNGEYE